MLTDGQLLEIGNSRTVIVVVTVFPIAVNFVTHSLFLVLRFVKSKRLRRTSVCFDSSLKQYYRGQLTQQLILGSIPELAQYSRYRVKKVLSLPSRRLAFFWLDDKVGIAVQSP